MTELNNFLSTAIALPSANPAEIGEINRSPGLPVHPAWTFNESAQVPGFPSHLMKPKYPSISVRPNNAGIHDVNIRVSPLNSSRWRVRINDEFPSSWYQYNTDQSFSITGQVWSLVTIEFEKDNTIPDSAWNSLYLNEISMVPGSCVLYFGEGPPHLLIGDFRILDFDLYAVNNLSYYFLGYRNLSAQLIDKILIVMNQSTAGPSTGTFNYVGNPGSPDELRSDEAMAALTELIQKGVTITR